MKILLASQAIAGHFNPMTGIGVRLRDEGHDVGWYTGRTLDGKLEELSIPLYPFERAIEHTGDNLNELYPQRATLKGPLAIRFDGERIFASNVTNFFEDIRELHQRFPFDAVVMDSSMFIQRLVAVVLGKPVVSFVAIGNMESDPLVPPMFFGFAPARTPAQKILHAGARLVSDEFVTKPARNSYVRQLRGYGLQTGRGTRITDETYRWSHAVIQTGTASLDFPRRNVNPKVHYVGALLPHRAGTADTATAAVHTPEAKQPSADRDYRRTVVVTQGTVDNRDPAKLMVPTNRGAEGYGFPHRRGHWRCGHRGFATPVSAAQRHRRGLRRLCPRVPFHGRFRHQRRTRRGAAEPVPRSPARDGGPQRGEERCQCPGGVRRCRR